MVMAFCFSGAFAAAGSEAGAADTGPRVIVVGGPEEGQAGHEERATDDGSEACGVPPAGREDEADSPDWPDVTDEGGGILTASNLETVSNTGEAVFRIPFRVPPGRNRIEPELSLIYNSRRWDSRFGGWTFETGFIQRSTRGGVNYGAEDFYAVSAGTYEELVKREEWGRDYYGAKVEEAFTRYFLDSSTGGWVVTGKDGVKCYFGSTAASRQDNAGGVFKWCLDAVEDANGNRVTFTYVKDRGQMYPETVSWPGGAGTVEAVCLLEGRDDVKTNHETRYPVVTAKRLRSIEVRSGGVPAWKYVLEYGKDGEGNSRLKRVAEYGGDGGALPGVAFSYGRFDYTGYPPPPEYLTAIHYEQGARIAVAYENSKKFYRWAFCPYAWEVVTSVSVNDGLGNLSTIRYGYANEYFEVFDDGTFEFHGFEEVKKTNPDGSVETFLYHVEDAFLKRKLKSRSIAASSGDAWLGRTTFTWEKSPLDSREGKVCNFVGLMKKREEIYPGTAYREERYDYDRTNGNLLSKTITGTALETVTESYSHANLGTWLWRVTEESLRGSSTGLSRRTRYRYERGTGNLLERRELNDAVIRTYAYDRYGNGIR
ncbi:MAG TPA: SpvB/TcaC N-terminal domain-containing protein, partial [Syntrophales bacterium]|nr:SpvB/TcaC N-terminal domain-containing protein [Syntrophales bacterium]